MIKIDKASQERMKCLLALVCSELAETIPEKEEHFYRLQKEAEKEGFNIVANLCYLVREYYKYLKEATILKFIREIGIASGDRNFIFDAVDKNKIM